MTPKSCLPRALSATILAAVLLWGASPIHADEAASENIVRYSLSADFDSAKEALEFAITNQGLVITSESHIDEMLERTGADLGFDTKIYEKAVTFEFCSASFSRLMMEADPHNIVFCPFVISVYTLPSDPETVYLAYRRPVRADADEKVAEALESVAEFLDTIATDAME